MACIFASMCVNSSDFIPPSEHHAVHFTHTIFSLPLIHWSEIFFVLSVCLCAGVFFFCSSWFLSRFHLGILRWCCDCRSLPLGMNINGTKNGNESRFGAGFCFTVVYGALLTKTNRISRIFKHGKQTAKRPSFISPRSQLVICAALTSIQASYLSEWWKSCNEIVIIRSDSCCKRLNSHWFRNRNLVGIETMTQCSPHRHPNRKVVVAVTK